MRCYRLLLGLIFILLTVTVSYAEPQGVIALNKIWEYLDVSYIHGDPVVSKTRYEFGEAEQFNGKEYSPWILRDKESWILNREWDEWGEDILSSHWEHEFEECNKIEGYLREENGRLYKLLNGGVYFYFSPSGPSLDKYFYEKDEEAMLFDINADLFSSFPTIEDKYILCTGFVTKILEEYPNVEEKRGIRVSTNYRWQEYYNGLLEYGSMSVINDMWQCPYFLDTFYMNIIERIGPTANGSLCDMMSKPYAGIISAGWDTYNLLRVTEHGHVIYEDLTAIPDDLANTKLPKAGDDTYHFSKLYDLMGREIRNPQPGTIYIRCGKKYVAK